jgi:hypothetical protein
VGIDRIMRRALVLMVLIGAPASMLAACGLADSRSPVPEFLRAKEPDPPPPEAAPDVTALIRKDLDTIFVPTSYPRDIQVSAAHRDVRGNAWIACVRAQLTSATGAPLGSQTYRLTIANGQIADRRRVENEDNCASENYAAIGTAK